MKCVVQFFAFLVLFGEECDRLAAGSPLDVFTEENVASQKSDDQNDDDAPVAPQVAGRVREALFDVRRATDNWVARDTSGESADLVVDVAVSFSVRD